MPIRCARYLEPERERVLVVAAVVKIFDISPESPQSGACGSARALISDLSPGSPQRGACGSARPPYLRHVSDLRLDEESGEHGLADEIEGISSPLISMVSALGRLIPIIQGICKANTDTTTENDEIGKVAKSMVYGRNAHIDTSLAYQTRLALDSNISPGHSPGRGPRQQQYP